MDKKELSAAQIIVGTPGKITDCLMNKNLINNENLVSIVLDEADKLLEKDFIEDIKKIFTKISSETQVMLFSATMSEEVK